MKYNQINNDLFKKNRGRFIQYLKADSIAIFNSNDEQPWNGDAVHAFKQNSDLFWLSGIDQEDTLLVIYPDCPVEEYRECLFIKRTNEAIAKWNGYKLTQSHAM